MYKVLEEAAQLISQLHREPTWENTKACIRFGLQSHRHRRALLEAERVRVEFHSDERRTGAQVRSPRQFAKPVVRGLVLASVCVVAVAFVLIHLSERAENRVCTGVGERRNLSLEDGSTIELTTRTCVEVLVSTSKREARLLQGEAFFTVHHDERRPFSLFTPHVVVEDLGTQFRVYEHEDETDIGVLQGEVSIRARSTPHLASQPPVHLGPGEGATVVRTQNTVTIEAEKLSRRDLERALAWREGALEFHGNSLKEAVSEINRYNVRQLVIVDPTIENLSVGGRFRYSDFNRAVDALTIDKQVIVDKSNTSIIRLSGAHMGLEERYDQHQPH